MEDVVHKTINLKRPRVKKEKKKKKKETLISRGKKATKSKPNLYCQLTSQSSM